MIQKAKVTFIMKANAGGSGSLDNY